MNYDSPMPQDTSKDPVLDSNEFNNTRQQVTDAIAEYHALKTRMAEMAEKLSHEAKILRARANLLDDGAVEIQGFLSAGEHADVPAAMSLTVPSPGNGRR